MSDDLMAGLPGDLPAFLARFGTDAQVPGLSVPGALARGLSLRRLRPRARLSPQGAADRRMRGLRQAALAARRHDLRADQDRAVALVPGDLPGDLEQGRDLGHGAQAPDGLRQLPDRLELAAQDQAGDGAAGAGAAERAGRGRRDLRRRPQAGPPGPRRRAARSRSPARSRAAAARPAGGAWGGSGWPWCRMPRPGASRASSARTSPGPRPWPPTAGPAMAASPPPATPTSRSISAPAGATRRCACRRSTWCSAWPSAGCSAPTTAPSRQAPAGLSRRVRLPLQPPHRQEHQPTASPA